METKGYSLTCQEVIDNLLMLADAYEKASAGKAPNGFAFNPTDAAANMKAAVYFIHSFAQQIPQWIPVSERLPDFDEDAEETNVLGYYPFPGMISLVWYTGHHWEDGDGSGVTVKSPTHWMPLPEPPEVK